MNQAFSKSFTYFGFGLLFALALFTTDSFAAEPSWAAGITEPVADVTMSAPVSGIIAKRFFEEGAHVKKGQVIVELDKRIEELEVKRRKLARDLAKGELDRLKSLSERNTISVSREEIDKKEAEFNVTGVEHELASEQLQRRLLVSPIDGFITEYFLEVGEGCNVQQPVLRIADTSRAYFISNIEARLGYDIKVGQKVKIEVEAGRSLVPIEGTVHFIAPLVDPSSGLLRIKVIFENTDGRIRPGVAGRMRLKE